MTRSQRTLLLAAALVLVVGLGVWLALGGLGALGRERHVDGEPAQPLGKTASAPSSGPDAAVPGSAPRAPDAGSPPTRPSSSAAGGIPPGLRQPTGEDLSNPETV